MRRIQMSAKGAGACPLNARLETTRDSLTRWMHIAGTTVAATVATFC